MYMEKKHKHLSHTSTPQTATPDTQTNFIHQALVHGTGLLGLLVSLCFFTATYDTAQVKLTLFHMGAVLLLSLWAAAKIALKQNPFSRERFPFLLPIFVYLGWQGFSYALAPYHLEAAEEFIRLFLYGGIVLLVATEFTQKDIKILTNYILITVWISFGYALLQILNIFFPGLDPVNWRGFFTKRVFSTHANPNFFADFVVFTSCIIGATYVITRKKSLLTLLGVGAVALFYTESKGAWLAYAFCAALAAIVYTNTLSVGLKKHLKKINGFVLLLILIATALTGYFTKQRFQSVSFRTHTWLATVEMIKDNPILGVGTGNFKVIYSAYRRPQIFYIEKLHNVETQHAENEILEQAAVGGLVGLALFIWLMGSVFYLAWRRLKDSGQDPSLLERNLYLWGYATALAGMFVHSWVDVSIHFVSSGFFFALLMGVVLALCIPPQEEKVVLPPASPLPILLILRGALTLCWIALMVRFFYQFHEVASPLSMRTFGEASLVFISWSVLILVLSAAGYILLASAFRLKNAWALLILMLVPILFYGAFSLFRANHYYSVGISLAQLGNNDGAIAYFTKAVRANPLQVEYRQFRGNVLAIALQMGKIFSPNRGDSKAPANDFERALRDFEAVEKASPNHPLLHHNRGQLYYTMALRRSDDATRARNDEEYEEIKQDALNLMAQAKNSFQRALLADPVNETTYAFLIQIGLLENDLTSAQQWLDRYYQGPDGVSEEEFLAPLRENPRMRVLAQQIAARRERR